MLTVFLTTTQSASNAANEAIANAIGAAFSLVAFSWLIGLAMLIGVVALITMVVKAVWHAGDNRRYKKMRKQQQREWERAHKQYTKNKEYQEFQEWKKQQTETKTKSLENNPDWKWDEKTQLWRHKSQWDKIDS